MTTVQHMTIDPQPMPSDHRAHDALQPWDHELVDVMTAVLVDPNLHTHTRMRLAGEIRDLLREAYEDLHHAPLPPAHRRTLWANPVDLADLLTTILVDPNLHTDVRLRLHRDIAESLGRLSSLPV